MAPVEAQRHALWRVAVRPAVPVENSGGVTEMGVAGDTVTADMVPATLLVTYAYVPWG